MFEDKKLSVECFKVNHRIECWGFLFREKKNIRKIIARQVKKYKVPKSFYENLHQGEDFVNEKTKLIKNEVLTTAVEPPKSYAYCADTAFYEPIAEKIKGVDLVYHESTYLDELSKKAGGKISFHFQASSDDCKKSRCKKIVIRPFFVYV